MITIKTCPLCDSRLTTKPPTKEEYKWHKFYCVKADHIYHIYCQEPIYFATPKVKVETKDYTLFIHDKSIELQIDNKHKNTKFIYIPNFKLNPKHLSLIELQSTIDKLSLFL